MYRLLILSMCLVLTGCSLFLPEPDKLYENLVVPLGKYDGAARDFSLAPVSLLGADYSKQEYFEGDFRGNDVELLVNWEKEGNSLIMVASAVAGQPVFVVKQEARQLVEEHRYFEMPGLKISWLLGDYQLVHLPIEQLNALLGEQSVVMIETNDVASCEAEMDDDLVCVKLRYLLAASQRESDSVSAEQANMSIRYYAKSDNTSVVARIKVSNTRWGYSYTVNIL